MPGTTRRLGRASRLQRLAGGRQWGSAQGWRARLSSRRSGRSRVCSRGGKRRKGRGRLDLPSLQFFCRRRRRREQRQGFRRAGLRGRLLGQTAAAAAAAAAVAAAVLL